MKTKINYLKRAKPTRDTSDGMHHKFKIAHVSVLFFLKVLKFIKFIDDCLLLI